MDWLSELGASSFELMRGRDFIRVTFSEQVSLHPIPKKVSNHVLHVIAIADHTRKGTFV